MNCNGGILICGKYSLCMWNAHVCTVSILMAWNVLTVYEWCEMYWEYMNGVKCTDSQEIVAESDVFIPNFLGFGVIWDRTHKN